MVGSLRLLLLLATLAIAFNLIIASLAVWFYSEQRKEQIEAVAEVSEATARMIALRLATMTKQARVIATELALEGSDLKRIEELLRTAATKTGYHYVLGDKHARQLINTSAPQGVERAPTREPEEVSAIFSGKNLVLTEPRESRFLGVKKDGVFQGERFFGVRVPVRSGDEISYVLTMLATPSALRAVLLDAYRPEGWGASIIDQKGRIVARSHANERFAGRQAPPEVLDRSAAERRGIVATGDLEGKISTSSMHLIPRTQWRVAVWAPHDVLFPSKLLLIAGLAIANTLLCFGMALLLRNRSIYIRERVG